MSIFTSGSKPGGGGGRPRVLLLFPGLWEKEFKLPSDPPYGLLYSASRLVRDGWPVDVYDQRLESTGKADRAALFDHVRRERFVCFGVSTQTGPTIHSGLALCRELRRIHPDVPIVWGGVHPSLLPEETARHPLVDFVVKGEGEETFPELVRALAEGRSPDGVAGVYFKRGGAIAAGPPRPLIERLDDYEVPWELIRREDYITPYNGRRAFGIITSRGCPFRCTFCYNRSFFGGGSWRGLSLDRVLADLERVISWGVEFVRFEDDYLPARKNHVLRLCDGIRRRGFKFDWWLSVRSSALKPEFAEALASAGCRYVGIGAESGSDHVLSLMKKDEKAADHLEAARSLERFGIQAKFNWILGYPGERPQDVRDTLKMVEAVSRANPSSTHVINIFAPYPGTEGFEAARREGFRPPQTLEEWGRNLREEASALPYVKDRSYLETVRWAFVLRHMKKRIGFYARWAKVPIYVLGTLADIRWRLRFFRFPVEYGALQLARRLLRGRLLRA